MLIKLTGHTYHIRSVAWNNKGELVSGSSDKDIKIWNVNNGNCIKTFNGHNNEVMSVC